MNEHRFQVDVRCERMHIYTFLFNTFTEKITKDVCIVSEETAIYMAGTFDAHHVKFVDFAFCQAVLINLLLVYPLLT